MKEITSNNMTLKIRLKCSVWLFMISVSCIFSKDLTCRMLRGYELELEERLNKLLERVSK